MSTDNHAGLRMGTPRYRKNILELIAIPAAIAIGIALLRLLAGSKSAMRIPAEMRLSLRNTSYLIHLFQSACPTRVIPRMRSMCGI